MAFLSGETEAHPVEEDGLVLCRLGDAAAADVDEGAGGQDDVEQVVDDKNPLNENVNCAVRG